MKRKLIFLMTFLSFFAIDFSMAQSPNSFNYQAVIRNANNQIMVNQNIGLRLSILETSSSGNIVFSETFATTTNAFGVVNLKLGSGTLLSGNFSTIDWGSNDYFLKVDVDLSGGMNYQFMGTTQLLSVPYALYAAKAGEYNEVDGDSTNELQTLSISNDTIFLTNGAFVKLPAGFDGQYSSLTGAPTNVGTFTNNVGYLTAEVDGSVTNELQTLSISNDTIYLTNGAFVKLPAGFDGQYISLTGAPTNVGAFTNNVGYLTAEVDGSVTNELQVLSFSNDTLYISDGNQVYMGDIQNIWTKQGNNVFVLNQNVGINSTNIDAKLKVEDNNTSDTTITIFGHALGGFAVKGRTISKSNSHWMNAGIMGEVEQNDSNSGTGVRGLAYGNAVGTEAFGVRGEAAVDNATNQGVSGVALSNANNPSWHIGGKFEAHGDWDTIKGIGTGTHYGVRAEATATANWACGVRGFGFTQSQSSNENYGARFTATGVNYNPTNAGTGNHIGVYGEAFGSGEFNYGVYGHSMGQSSTGRSFAGFFDADNAVQTDDYIIGVVAMADSSVSVNRGIEAQGISNIGQWNQGGIFFSDGTGHPSLETENVGVYSVVANNRLKNYGFKSKVTGANSNSHNWGAHLISQGDGSWNYGIESKAQGSSSTAYNYGGSFFGYSDVPTTGYCYGIRAQADSSLVINRGVSALANSNVGQYNQGGLFQANGIGHPTNTTSNYGVYGYAGNNRSRNYGVLGEANAGSTPTSYCTGVYGNATGARGFHSQGVDGTASTHSKMNIGVGGWSDQDNNLDSVNIGVYGYTAGADTNYGMWATSTGGYYGNGLVNYGIYAEAANASSANYAGFFEGNVTVYGNLNVTGNIAKGGGTFKIDHPLDPENKYLTHSFVESPEMINVYSGNITTDSNGYATVVLPAYFETVNIDFRYQLTCIGVFAQAIIKDEVSGNQFMIQTNQANVKVSWQVTATRNDLYAQKNRVVAEQDKPENERGKYLHPELYNKPRTESVYPRASNNSNEMAAKKREIRETTKEATAMSEPERNVKQLNSESGSSRKRATEPSSRSAKSSSTSGTTSQETTNPQRTR